MKFYGLQLNSLLPGMAQSIILLLVVYFLRPTLVWLLVIVLGYGLARDAYLVYSKHLPLSYTRPLLSAFGTMIMIIVLYWLFTFTEGYGFWSIILVVYLIASYIIIKRWKLILGMIRWWEKSFLGMTAEERREAKRGKH